MTLAAVNLSTAHLDWAIISGLIAGALAGWAARFGRLCTMSAIEDALITRDYRVARAWAIALGVAVAATFGGEQAKLIDLSGSIYGSPRVHVLGIATGGLMFGFGMALVGTCSFGLLVRAGGGDLRALITAMIVGVFAIAVTAGTLAPLRAPLLSIGTVDLSSFGGGRIDGMVRHAAGPAAAIAIVIALVLAPLAIALNDPRLRKRPRMMLGAVVMGLAVASGWAGTTVAVAELTLDRPESLSFVAPTGRVLLQFMMEPFRNIGFGVSAMIGVLATSLATALWRGEFRWEAFDDAAEMRRHLVGAALMGLGGVMASGCTIGQGLSASSTLAVSAPLFVLCVVCGARGGLGYLLDGHALWRIGRG